MDLQNLTTPKASCHVRKTAKRPHRKVRSGCIECKTRKVKCDEVEPRCSMCRRYNKSCVFTRATNASPPASTPPAYEDDVPRDLSDRTTDLEVQDLELLHHWTTSAYKGFGDKPGDEVPWQLEMPQIACEQPFLMRGILAMSALHLSCSRPTQKQKWLVRAVYHQNRALPSYRYIVNDFQSKMTEQNCHAVIGFASLTSAYAFQDPDPPNTDHTDPIRLPEWLYLLRGARQILDVGRDWISRGPMAFQVRVVNGSIDLTHNPHDSHLAILATLFDRKRRDPSLYKLSDREIEAYQWTLRLLRESSAMPFLLCKTLGVKLSMFRWVEKVPQAYLDLLAEGKPEALILLAHLCLLLKEGSRSYWYMEGAAERLMAIIGDALPATWRPWIAWPVEVINGSIMSP
ncbi:hypothetical protein PV11_01788 [Exophiala sideris]|uniref:Zn(2)-C6 fungal-type domain-containing protein n=1 Tax=Exophiala sideris TaxID=1016849 RepID=A0A0D1ZH62_9EURO|nr:hypothetical protein PV11_01788 [Exophiala sideris]